MQVIQFMILLSPLSVLIQTIYKYKLFTQASVNETSSININNVMSVTIFTLLKLTLAIFKVSIGYRFSLQSLFQVYFELKIPTNRYSLY